MRINRLPYARQCRNLSLPYERAQLSIPSASYDYAAERIQSAFEFDPIANDGRETKRDRRFEVALLACMCLLIGVISAYDTYLLVRFQETIVEENPMGRWLMAADNGSVALFVGCKFAGTVIVLAAIALLYLCRKSMGLTVAAVLSAGQLILAWYITFS